MVTSSAPATTSTVPTGVFISPGTYSDDLAWYVRPSGDVDYRSSIGVTRSYGRLQSPFTRNDIEASQINPSGDVYDGIGYVYIVSYGSPDRRLTNNGYFCNQYGYIAYDDYGVQYSYGFAGRELSHQRLACRPFWQRRQCQSFLRARNNISPVADYSSYAYLSNPNGDAVDTGGDGNVFISYGNFRAN